MSTVVTAPEPETAFWDKEEKNLTAFVILKPMILKSMILILKSRS